MNRETYEEAKKALEKITHLLREGNLTEEEMQHFENLKIQLSGQLHSIWWPFDWGRRLIMIALFLVGLFGLIEERNYFLWTWLVLLFFSPRIMGEAALKIGQVARFVTKER